VFVKHKCPREWQVLTAMPLLKLNFWKVGKMLRPLPLVHVHITKWKGLVTKNTHVKYQSQQALVLIIQKVKVFGGWQKDRQEKKNPKQYAPRSSISGE
jgi:hypothetical protein